MNNLVSYSEFRDNLKTYIDDVCDNHDPLLIKRRNGGDVVVVSKEDFDSMEETAYLLKSPANAKRLFAALKTKPEDRISFNSIKELKDEIGL